MILLDNPREKIVMCGDLVYKYEYYGDSRVVSRLTQWYPGSQLYLKNEYKKYLNNIDVMVRDNKIRLESQGLPLCLGDIFVLPPASFNISDSTDANLAISRRKLRDLVYSNFGLNSHLYPMPLFITLTYKNPQFSPVMAKSQYLAFIKRLRYHFNINFRAIAVPEKHQSNQTQADRYGSFHYHILLFDIPSDWVKDKTSKRQLQDKITEIWGFGFSYLKICYGTPFSVAGYVTKYLEKDLSIQVGRRYLATRNCWKPITVEGDELSTFPALQFLSSSIYTLLSGEMMRLSINKINHF